ncbi:ATP-binding protein [Noviherbaspirillum sp. ST9]|uniref:ATP-binding protein n=1 Tax=Noviherbaspirillum sp. ST9 TaxID=3401606 RepID=UPI003B58628E
MRLPRSLQGRLVLLVLSAVLVVWLGAAALTWRDVSHELDELLDSHLAQAAALLVVQQAKALQDDDHTIDTPLLHRYAPRVAFQVFHEGQLVLRSANAPQSPMSSTRKSSRFATVNIDGNDWRVFATYGAERDVQVYVGEQMTSRMSILWAVLRSTMWPMALALPLLALAVWWSVFRGVSPLRRLGRALASRRPDMLDAVRVDGAPSEMLPMVEALNALFGRIAALLESERRFTADAAHELRTPIAAIRAQAQVALAETDDTMRRLALQNTLQGCDRAAHLVEQLLTLSRMEADAAPPMKELDLSAIAKRVAATVAPTALARNQALELHAPAPVTIRGNEALLTVLVRNLVDNAVRYAPPSARIRVALSGGGGRATLSVEDSGPGMSDDDIKRLGDRFFRVLGNNESGSGLGWSIVRRIAAVHRFEIQVDRSIALGGLAVRVLATRDCSGSA